MISMMKNLRLFRYLIGLHCGLIIAACGGGTGSAPDTPVIIPIIPITPVTPVIPVTPVTPVIPIVPVTPVIPVTPGIPGSLPELRILVIGQSISSNCNEHVYPAVDNVFQVGKDGAIKIASDPFEWADCNKGSMWMPLGKKLIVGGVARKVIFMPIGVGGTKVTDWQAGGVAFGKFNSAIGLIQAQGIKFDFAFWHQGSSDFGTDKDLYIQRLSEVIDYVNTKVKVNRWIIAVHSRCGTAYDRNIESAQLAFGNVPKLKRYPGPNTNLLSDEYRFDACHLNEKGQEKMASMWLDSIKAALE
ncbi:sialate O-acetylesterase [Janthinobacterium sp. SUN100]|uniref:sialate O-acetylesterase n=1 Tax=Janthinobacterium sp. SUN100 TaxID=3004101 RepID=UPI0025AFF5F7|nr:sialate O-acetylesterase [Janthinobacterium sp. SUN100]